MRSTALIKSSLLVAALLLASQQARASLRDRIKQHLVEKMKDQPAPEADAPTEGPITAAGDYTFSIVHDSLTRYYRVHVPQSYDPKVATPLVVAFHGGGGDMNFMAKDENYELLSKSEETGTVVAFPNGISAFPSGKFATWNAGACCGTARDNKADDAGFIRDMVSHITQQLNIDQKRIFGTGMSNGGMMQYVIACELSDVFAAVASVAGTDNTASCAPKKPIPILHIHARNDDHVLFNGGAGENAFPNRAAVTDFTSVPETVSRWVKRYHCQPQAERVLEVTGAYCDVNRGCDGGAQIKLCVTETGGHSWPGNPGRNGMLRKKEPPSQAISANTMIWDFFGIAQK